MFDVGVSTIQGGRDYQEDSFVITDPYGTDKNFNELNHIMLLVADGVGGETAGLVASQIAGRSSAEYVQSALKHDASEQLLTPILSKVGAAVNIEIINSLKLHPENKGMATTLILCVIFNQQLYWVSIGDSHLYLIRGLTLHKLNADHSMGALLDMQVIDGRMSQEEAANHPDRNCLLSYLDGGDIHTTDTSKEALELQADDVIILASDGLDTLSTTEIVQIIARKKCAQESAEELTDCVTRTEVEGQDNTTVIVLRFKGVN